MKKYTLSQMTGRLSNGKNIIININKIEDGIEYETDIKIWRVDILPELKEKYPKETYILTIEKYDAKYIYPEGTALVIDKRMEFSKIEDALEYLFKNKFIMEDELIIK